MGDEALDQLGHWATSFRRSCLRCPVGATRLHRLEDPRRTICELQRHQAHLKEFTREYLAKQDRAPPPGKDTQVAAAPGETEAEVERRVIQLRSEAYAQAVKNRRDASVIKRLMQNRTILSSVFPETLELDDEQRQLRQTLLYRDEQVARLAAAVESHKHSLKGLQEVQQRSRSAMTENRRLGVRLSQQSTVAGLPQTVGAAHDEMIQRLRKKHGSLSDKNAVLRNVLLGLIVESGVNWAQDEELHQLMLKLDHQPEMP